MGSRAAGRRYAKAIIELAQEDNLEDKVLNDFILIQATIEDNKKLEVDVI